MTGDWHRAFFFCHLERRSRRDLVFVVLSPLRPDLILLLDLFLSGNFEKYNTRRHRGIQGVNFPAHGDFNQKITLLSDQFPNSLAL
jgi:hypothetical protein